MTIYNGVGRTQHAKWHVKTTSGVVATIRNCSYFRFAALLSSVSKRVPASVSRYYTTKWEIFNYFSLRSVIDDSYMFDAELVEKPISKMKHGKAADLDGLMVEHLFYSHWLLSYF